MPTLRPYQQEDVAAVLESHRTHRRVIGRAATGLGKAVELAALAAHYQRFGRVLILVDVVKLVRQLAGSVKWYTGTAPGIEMGEEKVANSDGLFESSPVIISTVQTQYSGQPGKERYRHFDPKQFSVLLLDECELFLASKSLSVVQYYLDGNPDLKVFGCTATPFRSDGVAMANLFDHVAFDRDILWGIDNGYLVPARQAFVRVSLDFSSLKVRKDEDGDADYSDQEIAERINNEQTLIELAKGILHVCEDRKSIVVCPDVASAKAVAHYLEGQKPHSARCVYGEMGDEEKDDIMEAHQRGDFQFLTSVMMLTKGYDDPCVRAVVNCRKTKSKRLYQQILGRGTRVLKGLVEGVETPEARRAAIAASGKPDMLMVNMVGVDGWVRDVTLVDILGRADDSSVNERAKELVADGLSTEEALAAAEAEIEEEREVERLRAEIAENAAIREAEEEDDRRVRKSVSVEAYVDVEYTDGLGAGGNGGGQFERIPQGQLAILRKAKVPDKDIAALSPDEVKDLSREIVRRWKRKLCSYGQAKLLSKHGYDKAELRNMTAEQASVCIEAIKQNGWKRPATTAMLPVEAEAA